MSTVIETGSLKGAARKLNLATKTIEGHTGAARAKIGLPGQISHYITWDRWLRRPAPAPFNDPTLLEPSCESVSPNSSSTATPTASSTVQNEHRTFI